jgi:Uncharacterized conserved protein
MLEIGTLRRAAILAALLLAGAGITFFSLYTLSPSSAPSGQFELGAIEIATSSGTRQIDVELAKTQAEQSQGLMYRTSLPDNRGMLFLHQTPGEVRMWMRNTYIPLDMVFIRADGIVHRIAAMAEPLSDDVIASQGAVTAVLELNGGAAQRLGIKPGDRVRHPHFTSAAQPAGHR